MAKGRPRKPGKRTKNGKRPARTDPLIVKGNDRAEQRKAFYEGNGGDCLGRAYHTGLLGEGDTAKHRLDIARKFARIYTRVFLTPYRCALNDNPRGGDNHEPSDHQIAEEQWMRNNAELIDNARRPYFDQLVIPAHPLNDPHWLARLLALAANCHATARETQIMANATRIDLAVLREAIWGIDALKHNPPERMREGIDTFPEYARCGK